VNGFSKPAAALLLTAGLAACNAGASPTLPSAASRSTVAETAPEWKVTGAARRACPDPSRGFDECDELIIRGQTGSVAGWTPADLQAAYRFPAKRTGTLVAIVDAFDNPDVASDLAYYRSYFGLGPAKFYKFNQSGVQGHYPKGNAGWGKEIDLDVEMVSAVCPNCTIYLIEANTNSSDNLYKCVITATKLGAKIVSNSWGGGGGSPSGGAFDAPGVVYVASSGDGGYGEQDPADYKTVVSVGGTLLSRDGSGYTERTWPDTGGGCSLIPKPKWQHDPDCTNRTGNDVSAVAWNVAEYDTYGGAGGWIPAAGTSISTPIIASAYGLANDAAEQYGGKKFWKLSKAKVAKELHPITLGGINNCPPSLRRTYLCEAGTGQFGQYSGPAGWGTPDGIAAF
jgi:hypothetical protein